MIFEINLSKNFYRKFSKIISDQHTSAIMWRMQKIVDRKYPNIIAENAVICSEYKERAEVFAKSIIDEFLPLCDIPHPSGHVEKMRKYLLDWGKQHNIDTHLDNSKCIYMDIPASDDGQNIPKIIFQCHIDMVAVADKTYREFDPETTPIKPIFDKDEGVIHTGWKTSLGADNGQGIATCLSIAKLTKDEKFKFKHGPIRLLFTYDEETTLQGCKLLNKEVLDSKYLINLDTVYVGLIISSAAGGFYAITNKKLERIQPGKKSNVLSLEIWGLTGGHSGTDINKKRGNTAWILTEYLTRLHEASVNFNIRYIKSGILMNAIPSKLTCELVFGYHDVEEAYQIAEDLLFECKQIFSDSDMLRYNIEIRKASEIPVLSISDSMKLYHLLTMFPLGVIETFQNGDVKTSNNIGVIQVYDDVMRCELLYRSTDSNQLNEAVRTIMSECINNDVDFTIESIFPTWPKVENNPLNNLLVESYEKTCDLEAKILDIHAGIETGYLYRKCPDIYMTSIGADIINYHTRKETLFTKSLPAYSASLLYTLEHLSS